MNLWLQTKQYTCTNCQATYLHDRAYFHNQFDCPQRETIQTQQGARKVNADETAG